MKCVILLTVLCVFITVDAVRIYACDVTLTNNHLSLNSMHSWENVVLTPHPKSVVMPTTAARSSDIVGRQTNTVGKTANRNTVVQNPHARR